MKLRFIVTLFLLFSTAFAAHSADSDPSYRVRYRVTFEADWSSSTHPTDFPSGAHFSPLIGLTHRVEAIIWQSGQSASDGIEQMAETGATGILNNELTNIINNGDAEFLLLGQGIRQSPGSTSFEFEISQAFPLVSLASMIAPSPDWFVGINSLSLRQDGQWIDQLSIDLRAYDSGTDSGLTFVSSNADTNPAQAISRIIESPFVDSTPLGRFVFQLIETNANFPIAGYHSGLYYDPDRSGEGINLIISEQNQRRVAAMNWYTYDKSQQLWLVGNVDFEAGVDSLTFDVISTSGTEFGEAFFPQDVQNIPWGTVTLTFPACNRLIVNYNSDEFGTGQQELTKLLGVSDLGCQ